MRDSNRASQDAASAEAVLAEVIVDEKAVAPSHADTLLPDGEEVEVQLDHCEVGRLESRFKWYAHFVIVEEGPYYGRPIIRAWNAPRNGGRLSAGHRLRRDYTAVTGLRPPPVPKKKAERFLELFLRGVRLRVRTRVVDQFMDKEQRRWVKRPKAAWYSVVDEFLEVTAGAPFVLRRVKQKREPF